MNSGNVNRLVKMIQRLLLWQWMCLRSEMVVMMASRKNTKYIEKNVMISEPTHMESSACVAMKPWLRLPTMR